MLNCRVIPCLLLQNEGLVKTVKFARPKYIGDPINAVRIFNDKEVDELIILDIKASKEKQEPNFELIEQLASECFMPLCYGGGIHTIEHVHKLFSLGIEKICLNTSVLENTGLITEIAKRFGKQSIVVVVNIKKNWLGNKKLYSAATAKICHEPWLKYIKRIITAGAGEILLNAVDLDGTMQGMDLDLITEVSSEITVPLIAMGGVGKMEDIKAGTVAGANAIAAGSFFVFQGPHRAVLITYPQYEQLEELFADNITQYAE